MKMNRSVTLSLFAVVLMAFCATSAQALVEVQLNLRYTDPADPNDGGTWDLLVQSDAANGMAGLRVFLDGISGVIGVNNDPNAIKPNAPVFVPATSVFMFRTTGNGTEVEVVAGDDLAGALILGVGTGAVDPNSPGNVAEDDLRNSAWDNSALIASGKFGKTRPTLTGVEYNEFGADPNDITLSALHVSGHHVRGDSLNTLALESPGGAGLQAGDTDRDFDVDIADLGALAGALGGAGDWGDGDTDGDGDVDIADLGALAGTLSFTGTPPAIGVVPEPTSIALALLGLTAIAYRRRRASG